MIKTAIDKLVKSQDLTREETKEVFSQMMDGKATDAQIGAFLTALRIKGETVEEITGAVEVMREKGTKIHPKSSITLDTCGTGGDKTNTFNISTATAFVVAGTGISVAKHGNKCVSSKCGSADVLTALGININTTASKTEQAIDKANIGFAFAPVFHKAMKHAIGPRQEIGIRTIFNILGPMTNPADAKYQLIGVYDPELTETVANVLKELGSKKAFVVHGYPLDEISSCGKTKITRLGEDGTIDTYYITPQDYGIRQAELSELKGGTPEENAQILLDILDNKQGPRYDIVVLNAAAAIVAAGLAETVEEGIVLAKKSISSGNALKCLEKLRQITNG
ncbi:MAG: anthranilate phosphoribosyltransferase [Candidatus Aenigmarchaeota archaeon]|nr:anthranilate phosphoribosyltransferase [Candidatus Aenigmarchaeota archaeon]